MLNKLKRIFTGPSWEEMGIFPSTYGRKPPIRLSTPIPYKPGTEKALWPVTPKKPSRFRSWLDATVEAFKEARNG